MQVINQDIKELQFKPVYLLFGEETYLRNSYKNKLKRAILGEDTMNFTFFEGKGLDVNELIRMADTMPFFTEKRLLLIEESNFFKSTAEELVKYLPGMPDTTCLVFVESQVDKRNRLFKKVKELGYAAELSRQNPAQLAKWAAGLLNKEGRKITGNTMEVLLSKTGDDMEHIRMELEKLISYTIGQDVITLEDVEAVCTVLITNKIFDMVTAIVSRQNGKAMELYEDLLALKEPPMRILFLIARQFNQLLLVKELVGAGLDKPSIASKLKLQPFIVGKMLPQARQFTGEQILSYVTECVEAEEAVKSGRLQDRLAVELLLSKEY